MLVAPGTISPKQARSKAQTPSHNERRTPKRPVPSSSRVHSHGCTHAAAAVALALPNSTAPPPPPPTAGPDRQQPGDHTWRQAPAAVPTTVTTVRPARVAASAPA